MTQDEITAKNSQQCMIDSLRYQLDDAEKSIAMLRATIQDMKNALCMHCYESHDAAEAAIYAKLESEAHNDCEGSYNCGAECYFQEYTVSGSPDIYVAKLSVEYNRHDKTYYFIEDTEYSFSKKD
jgi:hypothetical protein